MEIEMTLVPLKPRGTLGECVLPVPKTSGSAGLEILEGSVLPGDTAWVPVNAKLQLPPVRWGSLHPDTCTQGKEVHTWGRSWRCCTMEARRVWARTRDFLGWQLLGVSCLFTTANGSLQNPDKGTRTNTQTHQARTPRLPGKQLS